jgi:hypothetical protein
MKRICIFALAALLVSGSSTFGSINTYFGEDLNNSASTPLASFPNATAAEATFLSFLTGVGTETFEAQSGGQPLALSFPGAGTATLSGSSGSVIALPDGTTNGFGRYGVTGDVDSDERYWEVNAGSAGDFTVTFSQPVAAFGFYGIDIGDFGGQLNLQTAGGSNVLLNVPNTQGSSGSTDGSVLFYGFIATTAPETVTSIQFLTSTGQGDVFAFDDMTVGSLQQVTIPGVPEPASVLVWAGLIGLAWARRRVR